jgi:hypothetical protein
LLMKKTALCDSRDVLKLFAGSCTDPVSPNGRSTTLAPIPPIT